MRFLLKHLLPQSKNVHAGLTGASKMPQMVVKLVFMSSNNQQMS